MKKILIDTDPGIDDAMAIHMAFAHPGLEVVGLSSVFGNVHVEKATRNALRLVEMSGADCPVAEGAAAPLVIPMPEPGYIVHGGEGFGTVPAAEPARRPDARDAARFIVDMVNAAPGEITLCPIGPLTNIALALRLDPSIASRVAGVVIMGGAVTVPGNISPHAEANVYNDPHAAAEVFAADWPMTLIGLDVTEQVRCAPADFAGLAAAAPRIGGFLNEAVQFYFEWHKTKPHYATGPFEGCFMHDPSAVLAVAEPHHFDGPETPVRVVTEGAEIGRTVADEGAGSRPVRIATAVDKDAVRARFLDIVATSDACRAARIR